MRTATIVKTTDISKKDNLRGKASGISVLRMEQHRSAEEIVADTLRKAILQGDLKPGQRLSQADLALQLGVSRIPLRDALRRLEGESLVAMDGRRGTRVSELSTEAIKELYEIGIMLEERCTEHAMRNIRDEDLPKLLKLFDRMDRGESRSADSSAARRAFYAYFYSFARRPLMRNQILMLRDNVGRYHKFKDKDHGHAAHLAFRKALINRDEKEAARVLKRHLQDALTDLLQNLGAKN